MVSPPVLGSVLALRHHVDCEPPYTLRLAPTDRRPWLTSNGGKPMWAVTHRIIAEWRTCAGYAALRAHLPTLARAYMLAEFRFPDRRRRDPANWYPTVKACIDGIVDAGVLPDDSHDRLIGPDMRMGPLSTKADGPFMLLHLWPVTP